MTQKCRICDSDSITLISIGETKLLKCNDCGIHFLAEFAEQNEIDDYYKKNYKITSSEILETEFRHLFRFPEQLELISTVKKFKNPPAKLLDIGCDKAFFIDEARRFGYDCTGMELSEAARNYSANIGIDLLTEFTQLNAKQDIVVMWHSLEHIPDPNAFLTELKSHLNPGAVLFIRIPAFDSFWRKILGKKWIWLQPANHFFHYSKNSLKTLLERNEFSIELIEHRKPNNKLTKKAFKISYRLFKKSFDYKPSFRSLLIRKYEDLTGVELFAVAKLK